MDLNIYRGEAVNITIKIDDNTRLIRRLLGEDIVKSSFNSHDILDINIGDFIVYKGVKYYLNNLPDIKKNASNSFDYSLTFESEYYELLKTQFLDSDGNSEFDLVGNLETFIDLIVTNMNRIRTNWVKGTCDQTNADYKLLRFSRANCMQVLQRLCEEFEGEFYFEIEAIGGSISYKPAETSEISYVAAAEGEHGYVSADYGGTNEKSICFTDKAGDETGLTFLYHQGLRNIQRTTLSEKNIVTRLYAFGAAKNLASDYRDYSKRLKFVVDEVSYLEKHVANYGVIEHTEIFDDIYPHREGTISAVDGGDITKLTDSGMDFDLNDYLLPGVNAKLHFNTGNLGGYEFEVSAYNNGTKEFTLIAFTDEVGYAMPNATLKPAVGDKYVLVDIKMPQSYIDTAETALQAKAQDYLDQNCDPRVTYILEPDPRYLKTHLISLKAGDFVTIEDTDLGIDTMTRIVELTKSLANDYLYTLKLSDHLEVQLIQQLYEEQEDLHEIIDTGEGGDIIRSRRNWRTSEELRTMVFDTDGYFDMGNIKAESIETSMLSVGAKSSQFIMKNVEIEANYLSDVSKFRAGAGELIHLSIDPDAIRTWTLSENIQESLVDGTAYYIYAKCTKEPGYTGQVVVDSTQRQFDDDATYYYFLIGVLHSVFEDIRGISLTYGQTIINGKFIRTGKIESTDGLTYFDLDNAEIKLGNTGQIHTTGKDSYTDTDAGFWLGYDGAYKLNIGNSSQYIKWNGSSLAIKGSITLENTIPSTDVSGLGDLATEDDVAYGDLTGTKPPSNADVTLSAINNTLLVTGGGITLSAGGAIKSLNKDTYDDATAGFYLGYAGGYKLGIGNATNYLRWTGTALEIKGRLSVGSSDNEDIYFDESEIKMYDYKDGFGSGCKGIALKYSTTIFGTINLYPTHYANMFLMADLTHYTRILTYEDGDYSVIAAQYGDYDVAIYLDPESGSGNDFYFYGSGSLKLPSLESSPTAGEGRMAFNSDDNRFCGYSGGQWKHFDHTSGW